MSAGVIYTSREEIEVYRFNYAATFFIPLAALLLQSYLPVAFHGRLYFFDVFDLPLLVTIFFAVARRSPVKGLPRSWQMSAGGSSHHRQSRRGKSLAFGRSFMRFPSNPVPAVPSTRAASHGRKRRRGTMSATMTVSRASRQAFSSARNGSRRCSKMLPPTGCTAWERPLPTGCWRLWSLPFWINSSSAGSKAVRGCQFSVQAAGCLALFAQTPGHED